MTLDKWDDMTIAEQLAWLRNAPHFEVLDFIARLIYDIKELEQELDNYEADNFALQDEVYGLEIALDAAVE